MKKLIIFIIIVVACSVILLMRLRHRNITFYPPPNPRQKTSLPRKQPTPVDAVVPDAEDVPQSTHQPLVSCIPKQAERLRMSEKERLQLLENLGFVPDDPHLSDYLLAQKTTWWGKRLDPQTFWDNRVVWLDDSAEFEARRRGRGYPPIPFSDDTVADRSDIDTSSTGIEIEGPNIRYVSTERESAFWDKFIKTHPHPPADIRNWTANQAESWLHNKHLLEQEPEKAVHFRIKPESMMKMLATDLHDAELFGYPPECVTPEAYLWAHVMKKRKEYKSLLAGGQGQNPAAISNFFRGVYVEPKNITDPLTESDMALANAWKVIYLKRLRIEGTDESYINAYLEEWNLDESVLTEYAQ